MSKPLIIGFTGSMGVGKSTVVQYLLTKGGTTAKRFAGPLYEMQDMLYRRIRDVYATPAPLKDRKLLQWLGTEWGRGLSENLWIELWRKEAIREIGLNRLVLVEDVRFDNEAEAVRALGGRVVRIVASDAALGKRKVARNGIAGHASEAGVKEDLVDFTIENNAGLDSLKKKLDFIFEDWEAGHV